MSHQQQTDLSIVIVSYQKATLLENCLQTILETCADLSLEIFVVDNASTDGTLAMLSSSYPMVQVIANQENLGFASANNQALGLCRGRYVLLLNNDTLVLDQSLQKLIRFMDVHPKVGCAGPRLVAADGTVQVSCMHFPNFGRAVRNFVRARMGRRPKNNDPVLDGHVQVDVVSGACLMIRHETLDQVGPLDEGYFMYSEEIDWCYRAASLGWITAYVPDATIVHFGGQTSKDQPVRFYVERRISRVRLLHKIKGRPFACAHAALIAAHIALRWILVSRQRSYYRQILALYLERVRKQLRQRHVYLVQRPHK